jgi:hypothetical protein
MRVRRRRGAPIVRRLLKTTTDQACAIGVSWDASERRRNNTTWTDICRSVVAEPTSGNFGFAVIPGRKAVVMKKGTGHMLKKHSILIKRAIDFSWFS